MSDVIEQWPADARVASAFAQAKARTRREELDRARDEQDRRVEAAAAAAAVALDRLASARSEASEAVQGLVNEQVSSERAAALLDVDVGELRRLV